jgi:hypothetical protein
MVFIVVIAGIVILLVMIPVVAIILALSLELLTDGFILYSVALVICNCNASNN